MLLISIFVVFPRFVEAAQTAGGIFCQDKPKEELNITFVDADGNLFECRVPKRRTKGADRLVKSLVALTSK